MKLRILGAAAAALLSQTGASFSATVVLDFEGLGVLQDSASIGVLGLGVGVLEPVGNFYDGGFGGSGSGPGTDLGIAFSDNALAIVDADAAGLAPSQGNFGGEPTPDTVLFFLTGDAATMNVAAGFQDGFSFFYSSINFVGNIDVYSGLNATGDILASLALPITPFNGDPDPTGAFSPFVPLGVAFDGIARSVDFGGTINQIGFDNITFGSSVPLDGNTFDPVGDPTDPVMDPTDPTVPDDPINVVPVPASFPLLLGGLLVMLGLRGRRPKSTA
ncbi:MAG: hypothetical protein AAF718_01165 [Pseudomonadota bacterium]